MSSSASRSGPLLLPAALDYVGTATPNRIYATFPKSPSGKDGFYDITTGQVLRAVDACATWISKEFGKSDKFETVAYFGVQDLRYALMFFAGVKCGYKLLLISPRNATHHNLSLMEQTECSRLFYSPELKGLADRIQQASQDSALETYPIAPLEEWEAAYTAPFPYTKTYEEAHSDPVCVLHSSGSTGAPKPITETNEYFSNANKKLPPIPGRVAGGTHLFYFEGEGSYFSPFPVFHIAGFFAAIHLPVFSPSSSVFMGPPDRPATAELVYEIMTQRPLRILFVPPSILENLVLIPGGVELLSQLDYAIYAGGPLEKSCGDLAVKHTTLTCIYGSTETGPFPLLVAKPDDWQYMEFHPGWKCTMEPMGDGTSELVLNKDDEADQYRGIGGTILKKQPQYRTRDLFLPHDTKPGLWRFYSRSDDILVLSNGEKWNPVPSESIILGHPAVAGVIAIGDGKFQPAALVEAAAPFDDAEKFIEEIWPEVEKANQLAQRHGRIVRSKIAVLQPGSFNRAPKGTIVRSTTLKKFQDVAESLYSESDEVDLPNGGPSLSKADLSKEGILKIVQDYARKIEVLEDAQEDDDFFTRGMDSLEVIELVRNVKVKLMTAVDLNRLSFIKPRLVFECPSMSKLAARIYEEVQGERKNGIHSSTDEVAEMVDKYCSMQLTNNPAAAAQQDSSLHVVPTGSTGSLGRQMLDTLVRSSNVRQVTCLDRNPAAEKIAKQTLKLSDGWGKVQFKTTQITEPNLGLKEQDMQLFEDVDAILHNAWKVDFNHKLSSFEPQIKAVAEFCSIIARSTRKPRIFFISSVSAVSNYRQSGSENPSIPEEIIDDDDASMDMGYGQSKLTAERILASMASRYNVPATILRVGQIAGTVVDADDKTASPFVQAWNTTEWLPSLVATSRNLGQLPSDMATVDWIPINKLAAIILDLISHDQLDQSPLNVYNLTNPRTAAWSTLIPPIQAGSEGPCQPVPLRKWMETLMQHNVESKEVVEKFPALKLLDWFEERLADEREVVFKSDKAAAISPTMAQLKPVDADWMRQWMEQWGFLQTQSIPQTNGHHA